MHTIRISAWIISFTGMFSACLPKDSKLDKTGTPQITGIASSASGAGGACVKKVIADAKTPRPMPAVPDATIGDSDEIRGTTVLANQPDRLRYIRNMANTAVTKMAVSLEYESGDYAGSFLEISIGAEAGDDSGAKQFDVTKSLTLVNGGKIQSELEHVYHSTADDDCTLTPVSVTVGKYAWGATPAVAHYTEVDYNAQDKGVEKSERDISGAALMQASGLRQLLASNGQLLTASLPMKGTMWDGDNVLDFSLSSDGDQEQNDPILGGTATMRGYTYLQTRLGARVALKKLLAASKSDYQATTDENGVIEQEVVSQELWQQSQLAGDSGGQNSIKVAGMAPWDLRDFKLSYEVFAPAPLKFDNFAAYFKWQKAADTGNHYAVQNRQPSPLPALKDRRQGAATKYLGASYYITPQDPRLKEALKKFTEDTADKSQEDLLFACLYAVNATLVADDALGKADTIKPQRAIDALTRGKGSSQHFAALFASMARSVQIPTRVIAGLLLVPVDKNNSVIAVPHAWVEVLVSGTTWLPLEPQYTKVLNLPTPQYLPLLVMDSYEKQSAVPDAATEAGAFSAITTGMRIEQHN